VTDEQPPHVLVLAAGTDDRMNTTLNKALQPVFFMPMIRYVLDAALSVPHRSLALVVGPGERELRERLRDYENLQFIPVKPGGGAGALLAAGEYLGGLEGDILVLNGSAPLMSHRSNGGLWSRHRQSGADCTVATAAVSEPAGMPRVIGEAGSIRDLREELDCTEAERRITEIPAGLYAFRHKALLAGLRAIASAPQSRDHRLSETVKAIAAEGFAAIPWLVADPDEALEVADLHALWRAETILRERFNRALMLKGVSLQDPRTTVIDPRCRIERDVLIEGGVVLVNSVVEGAVKIESACRIIDSVIGRGTYVKQGTRVDGSRAGRDCVIGPYAHLRPGCALGDEVHVGNFVELKNSSVGLRTKISHLSYIGDAEIGRNVNVGCGFITCNYDGGPVKQRTVVEDGVFIGSDSQAIAPVRFGAGSFIATGTSVTDDVPPGGFAISRGRQVTKADYARKYGKKKTTL
jgi:bifunctional UDP-N-acetylglucosamine pyrophosphorylase/glucosamine-1-phosphate N-acetyltransferase